MSAHQFAPGRDGRCARCGCTAPGGPHTASGTPSQIGRASADFWFARIHGRKVAALEARCALLERAARLCVAAGKDLGAAAFAYDLGHMIVEAHAAARTDAEIVEAVEELIVLRMMAGMDDPVGELTEGGLP